LLFLFLDKDLQKKKKMDDVPPGMDAAMADHFRAWRRKQQNDEKRQRIEMERENDSKQDLREILRPRDAVVKRKKRCADNEGIRPYMFL